MVLLQLQSILQRRKNNYPRTAKEIAVIFHLDVTSATKGCKNAITILNQIEKNTEKTTTKHHYVV